MAKKHKKNGKLMAITLPIAGVALAAAIALPILGETYSVTIDTTMGLGELHIVEAEGSENWDTKYIDKKYETKAESREAANKISKEICDEGIVLLKNDNNALPLAKDTTVLPFGDGYRNPTYGGSGSGNVDTKKDYVYSPAKGLKKHFQVNSAVEAITLNANKVERVAEATGTSKAQAGSGMFTNDFRLAGVPVTEYEGVKTQISGTTALMFITRGGGEANDIKHDAYKDGTKHNLALSKNEKDTIKYLKDNGASKIISIIVSSNVMELDVLQTGEYATDAILWIGGPGAAGFESMADILVGDINPSGRTADIYAKDLLKTPALTNFGSYTYTNAEFEWNKRQQKAHFVHYEEGIYVGYKYYETAASVGAINYDEEVVYPFGYGLSYTNFTQEFLSLDVKGGVATAKVKVTNTGEKEGKDVVELYYSAPYTELDRTNKVEKATKNLVEFAKTKMLAKGQSEELTLKFNVEDMASYDYMRDNGDGTKGAYVLRNGDYSIYLGKNSHDSWAEKKWTNGENIAYTNANPRQSEKDGQAKLDKEGKPTQYPDKLDADKEAKFIAATNQLQELSDFMNEDGMTLLSRKNMAETLPTAPESSDFQLFGKYLENWNLEKRGGYDFEDNPETGNVPGSLVYTREAPKYEDNGLNLSAMRARSYYDPLWDMLLNQVNFDDKATQDEIRDLLYYGAYNSAGLTAVGKPKVNDFDGPQGISSFMTQGLDACAYCSEVVVSSTWNVELVRKYGEAIGQEGLTHGIVGWYGPAMNTHRTPFSGRNFEYYSEDGVLAGKIAASVVSGAADQGFYAFIKHFALNDQETNRMDGICTWATEQAVREIYLKPFEIVVKEARGKVYYTADEQGTKDYKVMRGSTAVMTSFNNVGTQMASACAPLLTKVLRDEWGFQGEVITDFGPYVNYDNMIRSGNDYLLNATSSNKVELTAVFEDITSPTAKSVMRRCIKNMCYTVVNSAAFDGVAPGSTTYRDTAPWRYLLAGVTAGFATIAGGLLIWNGIAFVLARKKAKEEPELAE